MKMTAAVVFLLADLVLGAPNPIQKFDCGSSLGGLPIMVYSQSGETGPYFVSALDPISGQYTKIYDVPMSGVKDINSVGLHPTDGTVYGTAKKFGATYLVTFDETQMFFLERLDYGARAGGFSKSGSFVLPIPGKMLLVWEGTKLSELSRHSDYADAPASSARQVTPIIKPDGHDLSMFDGYELSNEADGTQEYGVEIRQNGKVWMANFATGTAALLTAVNSPKFTEVVTKTTNQPFGSGFTFERDVYFSRNNADGVFRIKTSTANFAAKTVELDYVGPCGQSGNNDGMNCLAGSDPWADIRLFETGREVEARKDGSLVWQAGKIMGAEVAGFEDDGTCGNVNVFHDTELYQSKCDMKIVLGEQYQDCCAECSKTPGCKGFSYEVSNKKCFLKDCSQPKLAGGVSKPGVISSSIKREGSAESSMYAIAFEDGTTGDIESYRMRNKGSVPKAPLEIGDRVDVFHVGEETPLAGTVKYVTVVYVDGNEETVYTVVYVDGNEETVDPAFVKGVYVVPEGNSCVGFDQPGGCLCSEDSQCNSNEGLRCLESSSLLGVTEKTCQPRCVGLDQPEGCSCSEDGQCNSNEGLECSESSSLLGGTEKTCQPPTELHLCKEKTSEQQEKIVQLEQDTNAAAQEIEKLQGEKQALSDQIENLMQESDSKDSELEKLKAEITDKTSKIEKLQSDINKLNGQITELKKDAAENAGTIKELNAQISAMQEEIERLKNQIASAEVLIERILLGGGQAILTLANNITELMADGDLKDKEIEKLGKEITAADKKYQRTVIALGVLSAFFFVASAVFFLKWQAGLAPDPAPPSPGYGNKPGYDNGNGNDSGNDAKPEGGNKPGDRPVSYGQTESHLAK